MADISFYGAGDENAISFIENECFSMPWSIDSIKSFYSQKDSFALIAKDGKNIIAYIGARMIFDEAEIENIAVLSEYRGKRIGAELLYSCIKEIKIRGGKKIFLEVRESNEPARKLYEKFGFEIINKRKNYYKNPTESAIIMALNIMEKL